VAVNADEIVTIRVDFKSNKKDMSKVLAQIEALKAAADDNAGSFDDLVDSNENFGQVLDTNSKKLNSHGKSVTDVDDRTQRLNKTVNRNVVSLNSNSGAMRTMTQNSGAMSKALKNNDRDFTILQRASLKLRKAFRFLFFVVIALVAEFVITALTLASVTAAFKLGNLTLKTYNATLGLVGATLASLTAGAAVALATFKEYNAALTAFQYNQKSVYGDSINQSASAMRGMTVDTNLATMGVVQLTQAYNVMARSAKVTANQQRALSGSMDFLMGTEDVNKSFQAMANFVGLLSKNKKVTSEVTAAAQGVSKEFAKEIGKQKDKSAGAILSKMASGQLVADAGIEGRFQNVTQTLVAIFKRYVTFMARDLSDFGDLLMNNAKKILKSFYENMRDYFGRVRLEVFRFADGTLTPGLITFGNWMENFSVKLIREYLPKIAGGADWLRKTFRDIGKSFNAFVNSLEKFRKGSDIIVDMFGEPLLAIFRIFGRNAEQLAYMAEDNEEAYLKWGSALERLIFSIGDLFSALKVAFTEALPVLTAVVNGIATVIDGLSYVIRMVGTLKLGLPGFLGGGGVVGTGGGKSGMVDGGMGPGVGGLVTLALLASLYKGRRYAYRDRYYRMGTGSPGYASQAGASAARAGYGLGGIYGFGSKIAGMGGGLNPLPVISGLGTTIGGFRGAYAQARAGQGGVPGQGVFGSAISAVRTFPQTFANNYMTKGRFSSGTMAAREAAAYHAMATGRQQDNRAFDAHQFAINPYTNKNFMDPSGVMAYRVQHANVSGSTIDAHYARAAQQIYNNPNLSATDRKVALAELDSNYKTAYSQMNAAVYGVGMGGNRAFKGYQDVKNMLGGRQALARSNAGQQNLSVKEQQTVTAYKDFMARDKALRGKYTEGSDASYKAFARHVRGQRVRASASGFGEASQAVGRRSFSPMMGMMGGMILASGVTSKIRDADTRMAAERALGIGSMFGTTGMGIMAGISLMGSTSTTKASLGGALAGYSAAKPIKQVLEGVLGPKGAVIGTIIQGVALIGGAVYGAIKAGENRRKQAANAAKDFVNAQMGELALDMMGFTKSQKFDLKTGKMINVFTKTGKANIMNYASLKAKQLDKMSPLFGPQGVSSIKTLADARAMEKKLIATGALPSSGIPGLDKNTRNDVNAFKGYFEGITTQLGGSFMVGSSGYKTDINGNIIYDPSTGMPATTGKGDEKRNLIDLVGAKNLFKNAQRMFKTDKRGRITGFKQLEEMGFTPAQLGVDFIGVPTPAQLQEVLKNKPIATGLRPGTTEIADSVFAEAAIVGRAQTNIQNIMTLFGMAREEVLALAAQKQVNIMDPFADLTDVIRDLGKATTKTAEEMRAAVIDVQIAALKLLDEPIALREAGAAFTSSENAMRNAGKGATYDQFVDVARTAQALFAITDPNNPFMYLNYLSGLSKGTGFGADVQSGLVTSGAGAKLTQVVDETAAGYARLGTQQVMGNLVNAGFLFADTAADEKFRKGLTDIFKSDQYSSESKNNLLNVLSTQLLDPATGKINFKKIENLEGAGAAFVKLLNQDDFTLKSTDVMQVNIQGADADVFNKLAQEMGRSFMLGIDKPEFWETAPEWWTQMLGHEWQLVDDKLQMNPRTPDTTTPRRGAVGDTPTSRALSGTMRAHSYFNSMLTGKRQITSSLRFDNLGSPSSDHAAGRAYDLTGQNLGQYQRMIDKAGGFAEFHGVASSRHLHVVPPIGDVYGSRAGKMSVTSSSAQNGVNQSVTVNVYGAPGQSEKAIARHVVAAIEERERRARERN